jgi:enoyl-CoA hydratase/carnithine racemase
VFARLEDLPVPTVAAVQGVCLAAGLDLALSPDISKDIHANTDLEGR